MYRELDNTIVWEIEKKKIYSGKLIPGYNVITRNDNGNVLAVAKSSYTPMLNSEFIDVAGKIQEISGFELIGFNEFKKGKRVLGFLKNNRENFYIGNHEIKSFLLIGNSFDGSSSFFQGTSSLLIRCQNQFSQIQVHNKIRHTKQIKTKLEEFYFYLESYFKQNKDLLNNFEKLGDIKLTEELREKMISFVLDVKEVTDKELSARKQKQIDLLRNSMFREIKDLGDNMFGAFQGVTFYTTHELSTRESAFGNVFGAPATINNRALEFANKQLVLS
jgi:hypothetical protein